MAPLVRVDSFEEAITLANASPFGLGSNLYSTDLREVHAAIDQIEAGMVWVNAPLLDNDAGPFGGRKLSGTGRQLGAEGLDTFRHTKFVMIDPVARRRGLLVVPLQRRRGLPGALVGGVEQTRGGGCLQGEPQLGDVGDAVQSPPGDLLDPFHAVDQRLLVDDQAGRRSLPRAVLLEEDPQRLHEVRVVGRVVGQEGAEHLACGVGALLERPGQEHRGAGVLAVARDAVVPHLGNVQ